MQHKNKHMCIIINKPTTGFKIVVSFFEMTTKFHEKQNIKEDDDMSI
jgi:hypothetical protein